MDSRVARDSFDAPLLHRDESPEGSVRRQSLDEVTSQKIYVATEDLTVVIAGFNTSISGYLLYLTVCFLSCGLGYLLFRWLPRWRTRLIGTPTPLCRCQWAVVEVRYFSPFLIDWHDWNEVGPMVTIDRSRSRQPAVWSPVVHGLWRSGQGGWHSHIWWGVWPCYFNPTVLGFSLYSLLLPSCRIPIFAVYRVERSFLDKH